MTSQKAQKRQAPCLLPEELRLALCGFTERVTRRHGPSQPSQVVLGASQAPGDAARLGQAGRRAPRLFVAVVRKRLAGRLPQLGRQGLDSSWRDGKHMGQACRGASNLVTHLFRWVPQIKAWKVDSGVYPAEPIKYECDFKRVRSRPTAFKTSGSSRNWYLSAQWICVEPGSIHRLKKGA